MPCFLFPQFKMDEEFSENKESEHAIILESNEIDNKGAVEVQLNRDEIIKSLTDRIETRRTLLKKNHILQQRLARFISGSSDKDYFQKLNFTEGADEGCLTKLLEKISATEENLQYVSDKWKEEKESLKEIIKEKKECLNELETKYVDIVRKTALNAVDSRTGEKLSAKDVEELIMKEKEISQTLQEFQLHSIQKRHYLNLALKKKKNLAKGPIDFAEYEIMCIETQNNKEIIQKISEEIKNIMKRATDSINVLSHLRQKLYLAQKEKNNALTAEKKLKMELNEMRNLLSEEKMKYTKMMNENKEFQHRFILLQYPRLIEDYNEVQQNNEDAKKELQKLKKVYDEEMKILKRQSKHK